MIKKVLAKVPERVQSMAMSTVVAAALVGGSTYMLSKPHQVIVAPSGKIRVSSWGELNQQEVDKLSDLLKGLPNKRDVAIFCSNIDCHELALDFDNAFETAGWNSRVESPPLVDENIGINIGPKDDDAKRLAGAISAATSDRIRPGLIDATVIGSRLVLVISRKPK